MSYNFLSNIQNFEQFNNIDKAYQEIDVHPDNADENNITGIIYFKDINTNISHEASFLMIRAHANNDLLIQLIPYGSGVYIPAGEMWSVDSLNGIEGIALRRAFDKNGNSLTKGKIQWMIGYK